MASLVTRSPVGLLSTALLASSVLTGPALARPGHAQSATILKRQAELREEYDYVIVGGGTAGLTIADRLTEDGETTVLVVEYGYLDNSNAITAIGPPSGETNPEVHEMPSATRYYNITMVPQAGLNNRTRGVAAGCVVGGSSAVNGMIFDRGSAEDYDAWVWAAGDWQDDYAQEWGWDNLLPYFKKSVTFHPPDERMQEEYGMTSDVEAAYGGDTPIHSSYAPFQWPAQKLMWDAFKSVDGIDFPVEAADGHAVGVFWFPNSIDPSTRTRSYAQLGHYSNEGGPSERTNFHLLPAHRVTQLLLEPAEDDDGEEVLEAVGVKLMPRDGDLPSSAHQVRASKEVIVSAGAIHSPQLLQRSGIGPRDVLEAAGVDVKLHLPGVGWNFQDHTTYSASFSWGINVEPNSGTLQRDREYAALAMELWRANKTGPHAAYPNSGAFLPLNVLTPSFSSIVSDILAQDPAEYLPADLDPTLVAGHASQLSVLARQLNSSGSAVLELLFTGASSFTLINLHPLSRGTVHLAPDDDGDARGSVEPLVDYRALSNPVDLEVNRALLSFFREFLAGEAMVESLDPSEVGALVGVDAASDEFVEYLRATLTPSVAHPSGTCALGPRELGGVVDPQLKVHGTRRLRVADCSIMTLVPGTHTSSTAYALGEKAADLIRGISSV
ncbi:related to alcohol oxidase [Cephalotrichum gorgonifer]|uniref:Related to alcohol oxidase n=1 Tax=Cephalotrichum gorgonifer TaxID=2041049 RepID=A0AAE8N187_9PEZI|nr:related to alcohol oxidase [Cephalotrichum gorgonifer]